jgi:hypothetical protein
MAGRSRFLMLISAPGADLMMATIAMMQALQRDEPQAATAPRRKHAKLQNFSVTATP